MKKTLSIVLFILSFKLSANVAFIDLIKKGLNKSPEYSKYIDYKIYEETLSSSKRSKLFFPSLGLSYQTSKDNGYYDENIIDSNLIQLSANYSLFSFGADYNDFKGQQYSLKAFNSATINSLLKVEYKIAQFLLGYIKITLELATLDNIIKTKESLYNIAKNKYKNGGISKNDLIRVKIDLAETKSQRISKNNQLLENKNNLKNYEILDVLEVKDLIHFPWDQYFQKSKLSFIKDLTYKELTSPSINKLKFELEAHKYKETASKREFFGNVSLNFSRNIYTLQDDDERYGWSGSIIYTLPLFENYSHKAELDLHKASIISKRKELDFIQKNMESYITDKKENLKDSLSNYLLLKDIEKDLLYLQNNLQRRYKKGIISTSNLFLEQDRILQAQNNLIFANYNLHLNFLDLLQLHGRSITQEVDYIK